MFNFFFFFLKHKVKLDCIQLNNTLEAFMKNFNNHTYQAKKDALILRIQYSLFSFFLAKLHQYLSLEKISMELPRTNPTQGDLSHLRTCNWLCSVAAASSTPASLLSNRFMLLYTTNARRFWGQDMTYVSFIFPAATQPTNSKFEINGDTGNMPKNYLFKLHFYNQLTTICYHITYCCL